MPLNIYEMLQRLGVANVYAFQFITDLYFKLDNIPCVEIRDEYGLLMKCGLPPCSNCQYRANAYKELEEYLTDYVKQDEEIYQ